MTLSIELTLEEQAQVARNAALEGLSPQEYAVKRLLGRATGSNPKDRNSTSLADLFEQWRLEDKTEDDNELAARDQDLAELKANLNANRDATGERRLFS